MSLMRKRTFSRPPVGRRLRQARELDGLSSSDLSTLSGLSRGVAGMIERGHIQKPTGEVLGALARSLGITTDWLILGTGEAPSEEQVKAAVARARAARGHKDAPEEDAA